MQRWLELFYLCLERCEVAVDLEGFAVDVTIASGIVESILFGVSVQHEQRGSCVEQ